ncbi:efflux RND transporter periplasmic adaptor subunit [Methylobacter psychrophilus]|uniref:efflux RND transporter periplasmic adaptor subunit n=1 Tax=Methylobacter psychrophilus TaxID=96941 RepID=UPI0021D4EBD1|nr:efflux RND transporter periplasmic adaptor subunit [Methylobacter psychrophilus]
MPHQRKKQFLCGLLVAAVLTACSDSADKTQPVPQPPKVKGEVHLAPDSPKKAYVKVASLSLTQHPLLEPLTGKINYNESVTSRISSPVAGRVIAIPVVLGTQVKAGSILLELDSPDVAAAEADYAKAQADLILRSKSFTRQQELYEGKAIAQKDLEQAQNDFNGARSEVRRTQDKLKNLRISAQQSDGRFALRSPVSGIVVERNVNPGIEVRPDREMPLFVVSDTKKLTLLMAVFEVNIAKIKLGQKLSIVVPAYPNEIFPATVEYIGQVLDEKTRTVQVRCDLPNPDGRLLPGMYASITVNSTPDDQAIVIPLTAVFTEGDADFVFIALDENRYQQRPVEIGLRLKDKAVITKGLQSGEKLVMEGALTLRAEEEVETGSDKP